MDTSQNITKKISNILAILVLTSFFLVPIRANALSLGLLGWGGLTSFTTPCTCSGALWIWYAPLYPIQTFPLLSGALTYMPGQTILKAWGLIGVPTTWALGQFIPGLQVCLIGAPPACAPLPSLGHMYLVGTSNPASSIIGQP
jgi:hypothetical protein